ncbi:molybdenum cofactor guanylyltransferase [Actinomadura flavalba]|uniref:molybdenum cofactor guanylyltransferase n=1 Tax=Actinomadura flavalba TaxID=1120938 RepID=UPI000378758E|nr:NTP transferase domain-containing protein [Actinomadura flavalba]
MFDAVVLAGGRARRLGADKPAATVAGRPLLAWVADAVPDAARLVVVGPHRPGLAPGAVTVREDPPGAGPIPALRAGLAHVTAPHVTLLAADLPFLRPAHLAALRAAAGDGGAVLLDAAGREQWLVGHWPAARLRAALDGYDGASVRGLLGPLAPVGVTLPGGGAPPWFDCDTPAELAAADRISAACQSGGTAPTRGDVPHAGGMDSGGLPGTRHRP